MPCSRSNSEITLIFDHLEFRPSSEQFQILRLKLLTVEGIISIELHTDWGLRPQLTAVFHNNIGPEVMLRKMAVALRGLRRSSASTDQAAAGERQPVPQSADQESVTAVINSSPDAILQNKMQIIVSSAQPRLATTLRQGFYGTLATASFAMAWVGLLVPGIPTVPFVLLTAHLALKSSPRFREKLLSSRTFGPMMRDWQNHRAVRRGVRTRAYALTLILVGVTLFLAPVSAVLYLVIVTMAVLGLVLISRLPVIEEIPLQQTLDTTNTEFPRLATETT